MPRYDKVVLAVQAQELGFQTGVFEKACRLTEILRFINETSELRDVLALKGGTAINLTMFDLPRLSVDIDLDFAENMPKAETQARRVKIRDIVEKHMIAEGYAKNTKSKSTYILDSLVYSYTNAAGNPDNIKIEINYLLRSHILPMVDATAQIAGIVDPFIVRTLAPLEIFGSKIVALSNRAAARDLYDLNNLVCNKSLGETEIDMLRRCAIFYLAVTGDFSTLGFDVSRIDSITHHKIKIGLSPVLRKAEQFDLMAAGARVRAFINEKMMLSDKETEFIRRFASGRYEPELLFEDSDITRRIESHPMVVWRISHILKK